MYRYETHLHTSPVSKCGRATVRGSLEFYKRAGYDGVFITNHFLDGNINIDFDRPNEEKIKFYLADYEEGVKIGEEIGIKVFFGVELSYRGTDFLIYGLDGEWYRAHPEIMDMKKSEELPYLCEAGALTVQAHPFREAAYIDHIRLFPRAVQGVEVINATCSDLENGMANIYADAYGLLKIAGSDNHIAQKIKRLAGIETAAPLQSVQDFIRAVTSGQARTFCEPNIWME